MSIEEFFKTTDYPAFQELGNLFTYLITIYPKNVRFNDDYFMPRANLSALRNSCMHALGLRGCNSKMVFPCLFLMLASAPL